MCTISKVCHDTNKNIKYIIQIVALTASAALTRPTKDKVYLKLKYSAEQGHAFLRGQSIDCPFACLPACLTPDFSYGFSLAVTPRNTSLRRDGISIKCSSSIDRTLNPASFSLYTSISSSPRGSMLALPGQFAPFVYGLILDRPKKRTKLSFFLL